MVFYKNCKFLIPPNFLLDRKIPSLCGKSVFGMLCPPRPYLAMSGRGTADAPFHHYEIRYLAALIRASIASSEPFLTAITPLGSMR